MQWVKVLALGAHICGVARGGWQRTVRISSDSPSAISTTGSRPSNVANAGALAPLSTDTLIVDPLLRPGQCVARW